MIRTVVQYLDSDKFGGCEEVVILLLAGLDRSRWRPVLLHHDEPGITRLIQEAGRLGVDCHSVPRISSQNVLKSFWRFTRKLRALTPAIFHAHLNWPLGCRYGLLAAKVSRVPQIVATSHLYCSIAGVRFGQWKHRMQVGCINRYLAVSGEVKDRLCQDLRVPESKVEVVHNGIRLPSQTLPADPALIALLRNGNRQSIVFTPARLHGQKGHTYLLEAAAQVPDAVFILAGDGPEKDSLEAQARKLGLERRVRFLGQRQDVPQLLACCDLFVLPSLFEGLPLSVLEAMASGKPVIATQIGGTSEAVIHGKTGLLVPPRNSTALADAIRSMLANPAMAAQMAVAGKQRVRALFSSESMVTGVTRVYDALLQS